MRPTPIMGAATVAQYDSTWASQDHWGGMVNLLIRDGNNWDRTDTRFPFLRSHDAYAGHSWAAGHGDFGDGNNQESSSESMNFATAAILWGEATGQTDIRDLGVYLHATEKTAVEQYWFDVDNAVFPAAYPHVAIGMVWGGKGVHSTWFGANPEFIHGINILPVNGGSLYLGHHPDHVLANYAEIVAERGGQPIIWQDLLWEYLALADPNLALSHYFADSGYDAVRRRIPRPHAALAVQPEEDGPGGNDDLRRHSRPTPSSATRPAYLTYVAYNAGPADRLVTFTDGFSFTVGPRQTASFSTSPANPEAPVVLLLANKTSGKAPLTIQFEGSQSFDPNGRPPDVRLVVRRRGLEHRGRHDRHLHRRRRPLGPPHGHQFARPLRAGQRPGDRAAQRHPVLRLAGAGARENRGGDATTSAAKASPTTT